MVVLEIVLGIVLSADFGGVNDCMEQEDGLDVVAIQR